jgi:hypothetical protein
VGKGAAPEENREGQGFHVELDGKNGGGDPWHTDGRLAIVTLRRSE